MSQMLPEGGEVMRRAMCGDVCPVPPPPTTTRSENKELLRQQLLSTSKERLEKAEPPKQKLGRSRQKNRWKLKFHHQALPQEYLDHYEQSLQRASTKATKPKAEKPEPSVDVNRITNETFKIWAQRLAGIQSDAGSLTVPVIAPQPAKPEDRKQRSPAIAPSKIVSYEDLPYMGEMTLNNSKPRRGRKPKKADICHLIYENYGTVVPGQPPPAPACPPAPRTDLQNRIISSLLERKLSQEQRRRLEVGSPRGPMPPAPPTLAGPLHSDDEPLNLCVRDLRDLKLQIQRKFGNIYCSPPEVKSEPEPDSPRSETSNAISVIQRNTNLSDGSSPASPAPATLVLKQLSELLEPVAGLPEPGAAPAGDRRRRASPRPRGAAKRKRSAIFIPPVPARSAAPTAEVSICKFKFTGGSKPSLQEKKMLSVDSGGNFRYYSGTGNKGNKSYDFLHKDASSAPPEPGAPQEPPQDAAGKKRKSRKSLQREKLERTFKEKGFLIQTQQLQSAEGATYCKFRQLRKFTRYLFRSWKDYLPGELAPPGGEGG